MGKSTWLEALLTVFFFHFTFGCTGGDDRKSRGFRLHNTWLRHTLEVSCLPLLLCSQHKSLSLSAFASKSICPFSTVQCNSNQGKESGLQNKLLYISVGYIIQTNEISRRVEKQKGAKRKWSVMCNYFLLSLSGKVWNDDSGLSGWDLGSPYLLGTEIRTTAAATTGRKGDSQPQRLIVWQVCGQI